MPIDASLLACNGVYGVSTPVPAAMNDKLLLLFVPLYLTPDSLALNMLPVEQCYMIACVHGKQIS